jgi:hypothetical protein
MAQAARAEAAGSALAPAWPARPARMAAVLDHIRVLPFIIR